MEALKAYVTGPSSQHEAESTVRLLVTHSNLKARFMEIRLDKHMSILSVKEKLQSHCGTSAGSMVLWLKNGHGERLHMLGPDTVKLGYFSPENGHILHVEDTDPLSLSAQGWLEDVSKVEKYVMSDAEYDKRENTYRKFKQERLKEDPTWTLEKEIARRRGVLCEDGVSCSGREVVDDDEYQAEEASHVVVGGRCEVVTQEGSKRGVVRYVGNGLKGLPKGYWVGVEYDEPVGKNDGSVKGVRYFECGAMYGAFVRPAAVSVGEYPPFDEDIMFSDEDEL
jgi:tubulin-folding cofactor B